MARPLALAALPLALSACVIVVDGDDPSSLASSYGATTDGRTLPESAELEPFGALSASAGTEVELHYGEAFRIELDEDARRRADYEIEEGELRVTCRRSGRSCLGGDRGEVSVYAPSVEALSASSGAELTVDEGFAPVEALSLRASSGGELDARALRARHVQAEASSGGEVRLHASEGLTARASSGGDVRYEGSPEVDASTSSGGSVRGGR